MCVLQKHGQASCNHTSQWQQQTVFIVMLLREDRGQDMFADMHRYAAKEHAFGKAGRKCYPPIARAPRFLQYFGNECVPSNISLAPRDARMTAKSVRMICCIGSASVAVQK